MLRNDGAVEGPTPAKFMAWDGEWSLDRRFEPGQKANIPSDLRPPTSKNLVKKRGVSSAFMTERSPTIPIQKLWFSLLESTEFRNLFSDRVALHTGTNGLLSDSAELLDGIH